MILLLYQQAMTGYRILLFRNVQWTVAHSLSIIIDAIIGVHAHDHATRYDMYACAEATIKLS